MELTDALPNHSSKSLTGALPNHSSIKAERAIFALNSRLKLKQLRIDIPLKLFDSCINTVLTCGSEVWLPFNDMSYNNWDSTEIETKLYFLKHILGLNRSSTNILVRGKLGKFPLKCTIDIRAVQFYKHLLKSDNEIIQNCITVDRNLFSDSFTYSFVGYLKNLQQSLCDSNIQITSLPKSKVKKLVREHYSSICQRELMNCPNAEFLRQFKVQMKCFFFLLLNLKEQQKSGRLPFTVS